MEHFVRLEYVVLQRSKRYWTASVGTTTNTSTSCQACANERLDTRNCTYTAQYGIHKPRDISRPSSRHLIPTGHPLHRNGHNQQITPPTQTIQQTPNHTLPQHPFTKQILHYGHWTSGRRKSLAHQSYSRSRTEGRQ